MSAYPGARQRRLRVCTLALAGCMAGCASVPEEAYRLPPNSQGVRDIQTRSFAVPDEANILQVVVAAMQDMEYNFDTIEYDLGVLSGSKVVDADSLAQQTGLVIADIVLVTLSVIAGTNLGGGMSAGADDEISLRITLVVLPSLENEGYFTTRVTIQSELIDKMGRVKKVRMIENPVVYQEIFEKFSKALFLEGVQS